MSNDWFRFKRFTVRQSGAAMKVGTDGVLLGAWSRVEPRYTRYLDIGAGTGLVALMLAQMVSQTGEKYKTEAAEVGPFPSGSFSEWRTACVCGAGTSRSSENPEPKASPFTLYDFPNDIPPWRIDAVEIEEQSARQAAENAASSPWNDAVHVYHADIRSFASGKGLGGGEKFALGAGSSGGESRGRCCGSELVPGAAAGCKYDHIVSNPPWFVDSLHSPHRGRSVARHTFSLSYGELTECVGRLLSAEGIFSVILPAASGDSFVSEAEEAGLELNRLTTVSTTPGSPPKRVLMEFALRGRGRGGEPVRDDLTIETGEPGVFTVEYRRLTADFYLKF